MLSREECYLHSSPDFKLWTSALLIHPCPNLDLDMRKPHGVLRPNVLWGYSLYGSNYIILSWRHRFRDCNLYLNATSVSALYWPTATISVCWYPILGKSSSAQYYESGRNHSSGSRQCVVKWEIVTRKPIYIGWGSCIWLRCKVSIATNKKSRAANKWTLYKRLRTLVYTLFNRK